MALIVLNFKAYEEAIGENAAKLANIAKEVSFRSKARIIVAPQAFDIIRTSPVIETVAQHIDFIDFGFGTGFLHAEAAKRAGATGSIVNHSEHKLSLENIDKTIKKLARLKMISIACAATPEEAEQIALLNPTYIAIEPPELIGTGVSVSKAKPEIISNSTEKIKSANPKVKVLCGAGISNKDDVRKALKLGAEGVLLASAFAKAKDPQKVLEDLAKGI